MNAPPVTLHWALVDEYLKPLRPLFEMEGVTEIMINGHHQIFIEERGEKRHVDVAFPSEKHLETTIMQIAKCHLRHHDD